MKTYSEKTYSITIKTEKGYWVTNIEKFDTLEDIDWDKVKQYVTNKNHLGYGYQYGNKSNHLTSSKNRTVLFEADV